MNQSETLIKEWLSEKDTFDLIDDIFYGEKVDEKAFSETLNRILINIAEIRKIPMQHESLKIGANLYQ